MINFKLLNLTIVFIIIFLFPLKATEIKVIELHKNKSLDQLVLETENKQNTNEIKINENQNSNDEISEDADPSLVVDDETISENETIDIDEDKNTVASENITELFTEKLLNLNDDLINNFLLDISNIKSKTLNREFIRILTNPDLEDQDINYYKLHSLVKKLYQLGEIGKAYNLIKKIDSEFIFNKDQLSYFKLIELNYLLSTFNLSEACDLKTLMFEESLSLPSYILEKTDIFCLTLENKFAEAKLLNSLLIESEKKIDQNFQDLFNFMILTDKRISSEFLGSIENKELIFLYSAMLRINELPLYEEFIQVDPQNLSIPIILSSSTKMETRIKAANKAFFNDTLTINSLSALYQSVDFNSDDFNNYEETITSLKNNKELTMAFYYQLANMQIFPDDRLKVTLKYWQFAKNSGLEKIAYAITKNIVESITPSSKNVEHAIEIALAHISNRNFTYANIWINFLEDSNKIIEQKKYAKFLIDLNENDNLNTIIAYLSANNIFQNIDNQKKLETLEVLYNFLGIKHERTEELSFKNLFDDRLMPSYFFIRDLNKNINQKNNLTLFFLALSSMNNKNWDDLHPQHLKIILNAFKSYDQGLLIKSLILEILNNLEVIK